MKYLIYESPRRDNARGKPHQSVPLAESNTRARQHLESKGWKIVRTFDESELVQQPEPELLPVPGTAVENAAPVVSDELEDAPLLDAPFLQAGLSDEQARALIEAGFGTAESVRNATDDELTAVKGIGAATVRNLRKALTTPEG